MQFECFEVVFWMKKTNNEMRIDRHDNLGVHGNIDNQNKWRLSQSRNVTIAKKNQPEFDAAGELLRVD